MFRSACLTIPMLRGRTVSSAIVRSDRLNVSAEVDESRSAASLSRSASRCTPAGPHWWRSERRRRVPPCSPRLGCRSPGRRRGSRVPFRAAPAARGGAHPSAQGRSRARQEGPRGARGVLCGAGAQVSPPACCGAPEALPPLETIVRSHPLVHAAEADLYRRLFARAGEAVLGFPPLRVPAKALARHAAARHGQDHHAPCGDGQGVWQTVDRRSAGSCAGRLARQRPPDRVPATSCRAARSPRPRPRCRRRSGSRRR